MNREEFLRKLRAELVNFVSESVIQEQLNYYHSYIRDECASGKSEEDVVSELGDPRLIARSIIDAAEAAGDQVATTTPFRYSEEEVNYNTDEEDLDYQGAQEDSEEVRRDPFQGFRETREHNTQYSGQETSHDGQTVENDSHGESESPFQRNGGAPRVYQMGNFGCLITGIVMFFVLYLLGAVIGGIFQLLSPILMPLLVVGVLLWLFRNIMK